MEMDGAEGGQRGFSNPLHHPPPRLQTPNSGELESHSDRFATPLLKGMCKLSFLHLIFSFFWEGGWGWFLLSLNAGNLRCLLLLLK